MWWLNSASRRAITLNALWGSVESGIWEKVVKKSGIWDYNSPRLGRQNSWRNGPARRCAPHQADEEDRPLLTRAPGADPRLLLCAKTNRLCRICRPGETRPDACRMAGEHKRPPMGEERISPGLMGWRAFGGPMPRCVRTDTLFVVTGGDWVRIGRHQNEFFR